MFNIREWSKQANIVADILSKAPAFDKTLRVERPEFERRQKAVYAALAKAGFDGGIVYSDEHYHGDVPYLGGNTNISVEPVAGIVGKNGFAILAGLEGCYVAEQLSKRSGCRVGRVEMLKPYTGTHNAGYTECQEFYGAITLNSNEPMGNQIVTMLDVAARGFGSTWDDVIIPEFDYVLVEKTLGKFGPKVEVFNELPVRVQHLVGSGY